MSIIVNVRSGEAARVVLGENTAQAAAQASIATAAATAAESSADLIEGLVPVAAAAANYFTSRALGEAGTATDDFFSTDDGAGNFIFYKRTIGGSVEISRMVSPVTLNGYVENTTDGGRIGITNADTPLAAPGALVHIVNDGSVTAGLRVSSSWTGATGAAFTNNDNSLWEVFNRVNSNSKNLSWASSNANAYNDIPAGVTDTGERVGVLGWATSVNVTGYNHAGTLEFQFGVRGRAGFQGLGSTGTVKNAIGVRGEIYNDSAGATIKDARAGEFVSNAVDGPVERNYGVFAGAQHGTISNHSFYGYAGKLFNQDKAQFGNEYSDMPSAVSARGTGPKFEFGFEGLGDGSSLGSTVTSGRPYIGWHAEAHSSGDTFTTRGKPGYVAFMAEDNLIFARVPTANASNQAAVEAFRFDDSGRGQFALAPNAPSYASSGIQVVGPQGAAVADATDAASVITQLNLLLARLRAHGLIAA